MPSALLVIDMQNDFAHEGGSLFVHGAEGIVDTANKLRGKFEHVMWTKDWHPKNHISFAANHPGHSAGDIVDTGLYRQMLFNAHCVQGTEGAELHSGLDARDGDMFVVKGCRADVDSYSCFFDVVKTSATDAKEQLDRAGIDTLYVIGVATDYCVRASVLDALALGFKVYVIEDGIAAVNPNDAAGAIEEMREKGAVIIKSTEI